MIMCLAGVQEGNARQGWKAQWESWIAGAKKEGEINIIVGPGKSYQLIDMAGTLASGFGPVLETLSRGIEEYESMTVRSVSGHGIENLRYSLKASTDADLGMRERFAKIEDLVSQIMSRPPGSFQVIGTAPAWSTGPSILKQTHARSDFDPMEDS